MDISLLKQELAQHLGGRSLVMIGLMGSGKSSVGKRLASALGLMFRDADTEIEAAANMTIPEIFETRGEAEFRSGEQRVISRLLNEGPQVLATGGGAWMNEDTRLATANHGISIWLDGELDVLMERVSRRSTRPLLQNGNPRETMSNLLETRNPYYAKSDVKVMSRDVPHEVIVDEIIIAVAGHLGLAKEIAQ